MQRLIVSTLACICCLTALAGDKEQIARLISQLGDTQWKTRTAATQALIQIGKPATTQLRAAARSRDVEVATRARLILTQVQTINLQPIEFRILATDARMATEAARRKRLGKKYKAPLGHRWLPVDKREKWLKRTHVLVVIDTSNWTIDQFEKFGSRRQFNEEVVTFSIKQKRRKAFGDFTEKHINSRLAIIFQGQVVSAPTIKGRIEGEGIISGLSAIEAGHLQASLRAAQTGAGKPKKK